MMRRLLLSSALLCSVALAGTAPEPSAEFRFLGDLAAEQAAALPLMPVDDDERLAGRFVVDIVDGVTRAVYEMTPIEVDDEDLLQGLFLDGEVFPDPEAFSLELLVALEDPDNYAKLADFSSLVLDDGWYAYEFSTLFYDYTEPQDVLVRPERYAQFTLTRAQDGTVSMYIDGMPVSSFDDVDDRAVVPDGINLFIDDMDTLDENTRTRVARVVAFGEVLTPDQVRRRFEDRIADRLRVEGFEDIPGVPAPRQLGLQ